MQLITDWNFIFVLFISLLGFIVAGLLLFVNKKDSFSARVLAAYLFCASIICLNFNLTNTDFFLRHPHFWRSLVWASVCVPPFAFLYVRSVLEKELQLRWTDLLLFIPAILLTLSMTPFYLMDAQQKIVVVNRFMQDKRQISLEPEGMLPLGWGFLLRTVYGVVMAAAQFVLLFKWKKSILQEGLAENQNRDTYNWLFYFTGVMSVSYVFLFVETFLHISRYFDLNRLIIMTISFTILFVSAYLLLKPNILYGLTKITSIPDQPISISEQDEIEPKPEQKRTNLTPEIMTSYKEMLENHFAQRHPYLKQGYKIMDLAQELEIPAYLLSAFINQEYAKNFNELVNDHRVLYLDQLLKNSPEVHQYTLEAQGKMVGFNSRTAFITAVKKKTGKTPMEFFGRHQMADQD